jgi:signal transduction histidine kinase
MVPVVLPLRDVQRYKFTQRLEKFYALFWSIRASPHCMFGLEFLFRIVYLVLIHVVTAGNTNKIFKFEDGYTWLEASTAAMAVSGLIYQISNVKEVRAMSVFFMVDMLTELSVCSWVVLSFRHITRTVHNRTLLSFSTVPLAFSFLRYVSVNKPTGQLVIMFKANVHDLLSFFLIYIITGSGFAVTLMGLYSAKDTSYSTDGNAVLTMFTASLGDENMMLSSLRMTFPHIPLISSRSI